MWDASLPSLSPPDPSSHSIRAMCIARSASSCEASISRGTLLRMSETPPPTSEDTRPEDMTRRHFIEHVGFMSGTALLYAACKPSEPKKAEATVGPVVETSHRSLTSEEYDTVAAAVERICPRDDEPGAID